MRNADNIKADVERLVTLQELISEFSDEVSSIKQRLREDYDVGKHEIGDYVVGVSQPKRFDPEIASHVLSQFPDVVSAATVVSEPRLDGKRVKSLVAPTIYDLCCAPYGESRISIL